MTEETGGARDSMTTELFIEPEKRTEKGYSFSRDGKVYLVRCHVCGRENYAPAIATGKCVWCQKTEEKP